MLVRQKIQAGLIKHPGSTCRELAKVLNMSDGQVAGHLYHMEKAGFVTRSRNYDEVSLWWSADKNDPNYSMVTYIGNNKYRVYLEDSAMEGATLLTDELCLLLRKIVPELKYARVFTDTIRIPVRRNTLIKL